MHVRTCAICANSSLSKSLLFVSEERSGSRDAAAAAAGERVALLLLLRMLLLLLLEWHEPRSTITRSVCDESWLLLLADTLMLLFLLPLLLLLRLLRLVNDAVELLLNSRVFGSDCIFCLQRPP